MSQTQLWAPEPAGRGEASTPRVSMAPPSPALLSETRSQPGVPTPQPAPELPATGGLSPLDRLLAGLVEADGSDLHLTSGQPPRFAIWSGIVPVAGAAPLPQAVLEQYLEQIAPPERWRQYRETGDTDFAYQSPAGVGRFRVNVARSLGATTATIRHIRAEIPTLDALGVPPQVRGLANLRSGMCIFVGETGAGKSSTQAGLVDQYNETRDGHIVTIEDPVEYIHSPKRCRITHREVGLDTGSFESAMRHVRRQQPTLILVGEMRDYETMHYAMEAADSGHLVLTTLHAGSTSDAISRMVNTFPGERQNQVRTTLASVLRSVVWQTLIPAKSTERRRVLACEIMMVNSAIRNAIRANTPGAIDNALLDRSRGSIHRDHHLAELVRSQRLTDQDAMPYATDAESFRRLLTNPVR